MHKTKLFALSKFGQYPKIDIRPASTIKKTKPAKNSYLGLPFDYYSLASLLASLAAIFTND